MAEPLTDEGGEETGVPGENPWRTAFEKKVRRFKSQARLELAEQHRWQAKKSDVLAITPHRARSGKGLFVGWLLNDPATCECISGTDLLRQFYVLPH